MNTERHKGLIEEIAQRIEDWGLAVPAVFFLELIKPLSFISGQVLHLAQPLLGDCAREYALLLEDRSNIDLILAQLDRQRTDSPSERQRGGNT